jgi:hypothetical protein
MNDTLLQAIRIYSVKVETIRQAMAELPLFENPNLADTTEWHNWNDTHVQQSFDEIQTGLENMTRLLLEEEQEKIRKALEIEQDIKDEKQDLKDQISLNNE